MTPPGVYRHHKGGLYRVLGVASESTNGPSEGRRVVVYISMTTGAMLVRRESQFHELVNGGDRRFKYVGEELTR